MVNFSQAKYYGEKEDIRQLMLEINVTLMLTVKLVSTILFFSIHILACYILYVHILPDEIPVKLYLLCSKQENWRSSNSAFG